MSGAVETKSTSDPYPILSMNEKGVASRCFFTTAKDSMLSKCKSDCPFAGGDDVRSVFYIKHPSSYPVVFSPREDDISLFVIYSFR